MEAELPSVLNSGQTQGQMEKVWVLTLQNKAAERTEKPRTRTGSHPKGQPGRALGVKGRLARSAWW